MRILVVEDDASVSHWLSSKLHSCGHDCRLVGDGENALRMIRQEAFDVVVLDRILPKMDGIEVLNHLHGYPRPPVLILSANDATSDRVDGLRAGAEDYLGKPFDFTELLLRLEIMARRRSQSSSDGLIVIRELQLNVTARQVTRGGLAIDLTDKEFRLLHLLAEHAGQIVTRAMVLEKVWGYHFDPQTNLIDVHMSKLRSKIDKGYAEPLLRTVRSTGYVLG
ncbi:Winged helix family two component transcriptional regulator [Pseudomonas caricapapayae]|uniref:Winged helix family two component transcriptional regulator n=1 Tax=Pseudomonas caricapapayae TaxID=46678 RepID=A0A3M6EWT2_9PSED|nr:response regulator transcription factor [Pseudomonas caricapapayae]RMV72789.1 Winged helix family two component transcriptional regulator [Pseudomonas caricapapayae]